MKRLKGFLKRHADKLVGGAVALASMSGVAMADGLDFSTLTIDTAPVLQLAGIIVTALAGIWVTKKVIKMAGR